MVVLATANCVSWAVEEETTLDVVVVPCTARGLVPNQLYDAQALLHKSLGCHGGEFDSHCLARLQAMSLAAHGLLLWDSEATRTRLCGRNFESLRTSSVGEGAVANATRPCRRSGSRAWGRGLLGAEASKAVAECFRKAERLAKLAYEEHKQSCRSELPVDFQSWQQCSASLDRELGLDAPESAQKGQSVVAQEFWVENPHTSGFLVWMDRNDGLHTLRHV